MNRLRGSVGREVRIPSFQARRVGIALLAAGLAFAGTVGGFAEPVSVQYAFGPPRVATAEGVARVSVDGCKPFHRVGQPEVPFRTARILLPPGARVDKVGVELLAQVQTIAVAESLAFGRTAVPIGAKDHPAVARAAHDEPDAAIYGADAPFPAQRAELVSVQTMNGYRVAVVRVFPLQYLPASGTLRFCSSLRVSVVLADEAPQVAPAGARTVRAGEPQLNRVRSFVDNPEATTAYLGVLGTAAQPLDIYDYVLVTTPELVDSFLPLVAQKEGEGLSVLVETVDNIVATYPGVDDAEKLREFIRDCYYSYNITYVLLGGDIGTVPYRQAYAKCDGEDPTMPSDLYFACLDGSWNFDGDAYWGEPTDGEGGGDVDLLAEVFVGRAPVDSAAEAERFVAKTLQYEQDGHANAGNARFLAEYLGDYSGVQAHGGDGLDALLPSFTQFNVAWLDDRPTNGETWSSADGMAALNESPHLVAHFGHANETYALRMGTSYLDNMANTEPYLLNSAGCYAGAFDYAASDCFAEELSKRNAHGAFAVIMNSRYGWFSSMDEWMFSAEFMACFFDQLLEQGQSNIGVANQLAKEDMLGSVETSGDMVYRWCYFEINLFGDPHTPLQAGDDLRVQPGSGFDASGPEGGPFAPASQDYEVTNAGAGTVTWSVASSAGLVDLSLPGGTLLPGAGTTVTATLAPATTGLVAGVYTDVIVFSNLVSGAGMAREVRLRVGETDSFTELFDAGDCDLDFRMLTFVPDGSASQYAAYGETIANFPTDPTGGTTLSLSDDSYALVTLTGGAQVSLYGVAYDRFYVGSNGYITFGASDTDLSESLADHFDLPRISGLFNDLYPSSNVSWKQLADRVAVTFNGVREFGMANSNSFQFELFFDGTIRIAYLGVDATFGLAGLSAGLGVPADFLESDLTSYGPPPPPDGLLIAPTAGFDASGYAGGPFTPASTVYTLANVGDDALDWTAVWGAPWVSVAPAGGTLAPAATVDVTVSFGPAAAGLLPDSYAETLVFSNAVSGYVRSRAVTLEVLAIPGEVEVADTILPDDDLAMPFGPLIVGLSRTEQVTVRNTDALHDLVIDRIGFGFYEEDFDDGLAQGWSPLVPAHWSVVAGEYRAAAGTLAVSMQSSYTGQEWEDCTAQATMRRTGYLGSAAMLAVRASPDFNWDTDAGSAYAVGISGDGSFWVAKFVGGVFAFLQSWTTSPYLVSGETANVVELTAEGTSLSVRFNGQLAWSGTDADLVGGGRVALGAYSGSSSETVHFFDDLRVGAPGAFTGAIAAEQAWYNAHACEGGSPLLAPMGWSPPAYVGSEAEPDVAALLEPVGTLSTRGFSLPNLPAMPVTLGPGAELTFDVVYAPEEVGPHTASVMIESNDAGEPVVEVALTGEGIPDPLAIAPETGLQSSGHLGGPFAPSEQVYVVTNAGAATLDWRVWADEPWVTVSASGGTLSPGAAVGVTVSINSQAALLPEDAYAATVAFSNATTSIAQARPVALTVFTSPILTLAPETFAVTNLLGGVTERLLTVGNAPGADGALDFMLQPRETGRTVASVGAAGIGVPPPGHDFSRVQAGIPSKAGRVLVRFAPEKASAPQRAGVLATALAGANVEREYRIVPGLCRVQLPATSTLGAALVALNAAPGVLYAEPDYEVKADATIPNDARFGELWGMHNAGQTGGTPDADIDAPEAWDLQTGSPDTVVGVIDTGVDYTHEDLAANVWTNPGEIPGNGIDDDGNGYVDDVHGINAITGSGNPMDDNDHGTHCAGTIGAVGDNGVGVAGVCWEVRIMGLKFLDSSGSGDSSDAITCIEYAVDKGARVLSNSWGGGGYSQALKDAIDAAGAAGILFPAAAGNSGTDNDASPHYPSSYDSENIVAVMSTDHNDARSSFSCYGATSVDLAAPGSSILSCKRGGGYVSFSGTSMATPHMAGACALLLAQNPGLTASQVKAALLDTADVPTPALSCVSQGRLNLAAALGEVGAPWLAATPESGSGVLPGQSVPVTLSFDAGELAPGTYEGEVRVACNDVLRPQASVPCVMVVLPDDLSVTPVDGLAASGHERGPFTPASLEYTLRNIGTSPLNWTATHVESWVSVSPADGTLAAGATGVVTVAINAAAESLTPGVYTDPVAFLNEESGVVAHREVELTVLPAPGEVEIADSIPPTDDRDMDFGGVQVGESRTEQITINNVDPLDALVVSGIGLSQGVGTSGSAELVQREDKGAVLGVRNAPSDNGAAAFCATWSGSRVSAEDVSILVYADDVIHTAPNTHVDQALALLGLSYTAHYDGDFTGFEAALTTGGPWDLVILANDNFGPPTSTFDALETYVGAGGMLIAHSWKVSTGHSLWAALCGTFVSDDSTPPDPVYWWNASHPLFNTPESVPQLTSLDSAYGTYGQKLSPTGDGVAVAGYTPATAPNEAALIVANGGRTIFRGFLDGQNSADLDSDGKPDGMELWVNLVSSLSGGAAFRLAGLPSLPYTIPPLGSVSFDVTFAPQEVGAASGTITIASNDPDNPTVEVALHGQGVVDDLVVTPETGLESSGYEGGPFSPSNLEYMLSNTGSGTVNWTATHGESWVTVSSADGVIPVGATGIVTVAINAAADVLAPGNYTDTVTFENTTSGATFQRAVTLEVLALPDPPPEPFNPDPPHLSTNVPVNKVLSWNNPAGTVSASGGGTYTQDAELDSAGNIISRSGLPGGTVWPDAMGDVVLSFHSPSSSPFGLAWKDGVLCHVDFDTNTFYELDPSDGSVISTFPLSGVGGIAWDGTHFWGTRPGDDTVVKFTDAGTIVATYPAPGSGSVGIAWDGVSLWIGDFNTDRIYEVDPSNGSTLSSIAAPDTRIADVGFDGEHLWCNGRDSASTYRVDRSTGAVLSSLPTPPGPGMNNGTGCTFDGQYLWVANTDVDIIYQIDIEHSPQEVASYDIYLDTVNPPLTQVSAGQTGRSFNPGGLDELTTYYWQVVASNAAGVAVGPVWEFATEDVLIPDIEVSPPSLSATARVGQVVTQLLTVANSPAADGLLNATISTRETGRGLLAAAAEGVGLPDANRDFGKVQEGAEHAPDRLLVRFGGEVATAAARAATVAALGGRIEREYQLVPGLTVVELAAGQQVAGALEAYNAAPGVLYAEPDYLWKANATIPNDARFGELWGMHNAGQTGGTPDADIDAPEAWDLQTGSRDIVVGVIDTGVDYTHEDLAANLWTNPGEIAGNLIDDDGNGYVDDVYGINAITGSGNPMDDNDHGTHCAGTIGAVGDNGVGVAGVCWDVRIMALKFLDSAGSGDSSDAITCIEYAVDKGARVLSNSWGGGGYSQALKDAIDAAGAAGILFPAAAGNSGTDNDASPQYPSSYDSANIIAVLNTTHTDARSSGSCYGATSVDLAAPGSSILSCKRGGGYVSFSGTSMATPHVAGACALLLSQNPGLTAAQVKAALLDTVDVPTPALVCVSQGRLNLAAALGEVGAPWLSAAPEAITGLAPGASATVAVVFSANEGTTASGQRLGGEFQAGSYTGEVRIASNDPDEPEVVVPVVFTVLADDLTVTPSEGLQSSGYEGGPFDPSSKVYTLTNTGTGALGWELSATVPWLDVLPVGGSLAPGATADVTVSLNAMAESLSVGAHVGTVTFANLTSGAILTRNVVLTVTERPLPPPVPFNPIPTNFATRVSVDTELSWNNPTGEFTSVAVDAPSAIDSILRRSGILEGPITVSVSASGSCADAAAGPVTYTRPEEIASVMTAVELGITTESALDVVVCGAVRAAAWLTDVQTKLLGSGQFNSVSIIEVNVVTPTFTEMQAFDAAIVFSDSDYANAAAMGDVMADYVDSGRGVVCMVFECASIPMQGRWNSQGYFAVPRSGQTQGTRETLGTLHLPSHPILQDVAVFDGGSSSYRMTTSDVSPGSIRVADWSDGRPLVVTKDMAGTRRVDLGFYPPSSDSQSDLWDSSSDGAQLMANALTWVAGGGSGSASYDVFFGTNAAALPPIATGLPQPVCDPGTLDFDTTYYWQVVASNVVGCTTGPVWRFTTESRALSSLEWDAIAPTQSVGQAFGVTLRAKDQTGALLETFSGTVDLSGIVGPRVFLQADFETGMDGFAIETLQGVELWHRTTGRGFDVGHSSSNSLYYGTGEGIGGGGNYDVGLSEGVLISPEIDLSAVAAPVGLTFNYLIETEAATSSWDVATVEVLRLGDSSVTVVAGNVGSGDPLVDPSGGWVAAAVDLSAFAGERIRLRFRFNTVDGVFNTFEGWYVDDICVSGGGGSTGRRRSIHLRTLR